MRLENALRIVLFLFAMKTTSPLFSQRSFIKYVNPFIGTGGHGHTFPGATVPFGFVQLSPDTRIDGSWDGCSGYHYDDDIIYGFSHTHLSGTGVSDYGDLLLLPFTGNFDREKKYSSAFSHRKESASPGFYSVVLKDFDIKAELTATQRTGFHKYTFCSEADSACVLIDLIHRDEVLASELTIIDSKHLSGYRRSSAWAKDQLVFFYMEFSEPVSPEVVRYDSVSTSSSEGTKTFMGKIYGFVKAKLPEDHTLTVKVAISAVSEEGAKNNMKEEVRDMDFDMTRKKAEKMWEKELGKIDATGGTDEQLTIFYTALYHCMMAPNIYNDIDMNFRGRDMQVRKARSDYYTVFSLWDTFRAWHPLMTIIDQARTQDYVKTLIRQYERGRLLPVWELSSNETECMIGYHAVSVITDAYMKDIRNFNPDLALTAMRKSAESRGRFGLGPYIDQGYLDMLDESESVSKTLEYAYDDWCISQYAHAINRPDIEEQYKKRSNHWQNLFDKSTGFFRPKQNGAWLKPFDPFEVNNNYTEANAWQYCFFVPHNINRLMQRMGGKKMFEEKLDALFAAPDKATGRDQPDITGMIGQYAHGNEPSHHVAYLYNYTLNPWKTQLRVSRIRDEMYHAQPDGLAGNEDCGQMSAWYVLSAMGIYQICPGNPVYDLTSPLFDNILLHLENGKTLHIRKQNSSRENIFIDEVLLNDRKIYNQLPHDALMNGGELVFKMTAEKKEIVEQHFSDSIFEKRYPDDIEYTDFVTSPVADFESSVFKDSMIVTLSADSGMKILYTLNGKDPDENSETYSQPVSITNTAVLKSIAITPGGKMKSYVATSRFYKMAHPDWKIELHSKYNRQYTAGGEEGIIDGLRGEENWKKGRWQGYQGQDFEAVIDLGKVRKVSALHAEFLQDTRSWILMPVSVEFESSEDGKNFTTLFSIANSLPDTVMENSIMSFGGNIPPVMARYIKVKARNYGKLPEWHAGAGGEAFIFIDEIYIE